MIELIFAGVLLIALGRCAQMLIRRVRERASVTDPTELDRAILNDQVADWGLMLLLKLVLISIFVVGIFLYPPEALQAPRVAAQNVVRVLFFAFVVILVSRQECSAWYYKKRIDLYEQAEAENGE